MLGTKKTYDWKMVDIHNHSLFGVDDGSDTKENSLFMLNMAYKDGIDNVILTPHYSPKRGKANYNYILRQFKELKEAAAIAIPNINIYLGREVYYVTDIFDNIEDAKDIPIDDDYKYHWSLKDKEVDDLRGNDLKGLRMNNTKIILLEFAFSTDFEIIRRGVTNCFLEGFQPIVAHVERYMCFSQNPDLIKELREIGAYIQINADSIFGASGKMPQRCVKKLLRKSWVDFVASDAHNLTSRKPVLSEARDYITLRFGEEYARNILSENARKLFL